jgi:PPR repeat
VKHNHPDRQHRRRDSDLRPAIQQARQLLQQTDNQQQQQQQQHRRMTTNEWRDQVLQFLLLDRPREYHTFNHVQAVEWIRWTGQLWNAWLDHNHHSLVACLETLGVEEETLRPTKDDLLVQWCRGYIDVWYRLAQQGSFQKGLETGQVASADELVQLLGRLARAYNRIHDETGSSAGFGDATPNAMLVDGTSWSKILQGAIASSSNSAGGASSSGTVAWDLWQEIRHAHSVHGNVDGTASSRLWLDTIFYTQLLSAVAGDSESATAHNSTTTRKDDQSRLRLSSPSTASSASAATKTVKEKLDFLLYTMRQDARSAPDEVAYNIVIRFYAARCGENNSTSATALAKLQSLGQQMKVDGVALDAACHASLVYGYARAGKIELAQTTLQQMPMDNDRLRFLRLVGESVCHILAAHRQAIVSARANETTVPHPRREAMARRDDPQKDETNRDVALLRAETFYQTILQQGIVDSATEGSYRSATCRFVVCAWFPCNDRELLSNTGRISRVEDRMHGIMMEVYIQAGRIHEAEGIFRQLHQPDVAKFTVLVHGYGLHDQPGKAMNLLFAVLEHDGQNNDAPIDVATSRRKPDYSAIQLNVIALTAVMNTWRKAKRFDQAWWVFEIMTEHEKCRQWGIRPNQITYRTLLQCCLASMSSPITIPPTLSPSNHAGEAAEAILNDMDQRFQRHEIACQPSKRHYRLAIYICERASDWERAQILTARMVRRDETI